MNIIFNNSIAIGWVDIFLPFTDFFADKLGLAQGKHNIVQQLNRRGKCQILNHSIPQRT